MGIRLDWEIEAEQSVVHNSGEDRQTKRRRRMARLRLLLGVLFVLAVFGLIAAAVVWRLRMVDAEIERSLRDTVDAEVANLRIGDRQAFLDMQRSASDTWLAQQSQVFEAYQNLKRGSNVQLTGQVLNIDVDDSRGRARVQVEEIIDGIPYVRTWFYWRYNDGWRHVPPDYTFWGELQTTTVANVTVRYQSVDTPLAESMANELADWLQLGCEALICGDLPHLQVEILPQEGGEMGWSGTDVWLLQVPSPYVSAARLDRPFDLDLRLDAANLIAERLVSVSGGGFDPVYPSDAYYLRPAIISWLVGRFAMIETNSFLITSLAERYGVGAVGQLLQALQPNSDVRVVNAATGTTTLAEAELDWRDFLTWRIALENELHSRRDEINFLALYDTNNEQTSLTAYSRFTSELAGEQRVVVATQRETLPDGTPAIQATVQVGERTAAENVLFRLVNGIWKRAN